MYQIGSSLWETYTDGIYAREKGQATNPYAGLDAELAKAWQDGWDRAELAISRGY